MVVQDYFVGYNINIHEVSCLSGKVKVAKWLYFDVDCVFASFCENGTLEALHYLQSLGNVDIHANDDLAFRSSCGGSEYHGAKWLCEPCNGYTILVENDKTINYKLIEANIDEKINNKNKQLSSIISIYTHMKNKVKNASFVSMIMISWL